MPSSLRIACRSLVLVFAFSALTSAWVKVFSGSGVGSGGSGVGSAGGGVGSVFYVEKYTILECFHSCSLRLLFYIREM